MARYFVGIGGQRCGTSWLAHYLFRHPSVLHNPIKEMHVFDRMFVPEWFTAGRGKREENAIAVLTARLDKMRARVRDGDQPRDGVLERMVYVDRWRSAYERLHAVVTADDRTKALAHYRTYFDRELQQAHRCFGEITPSYALLPREGLTTILMAYPDARFIFVMRDPVDRLLSGIRLALTVRPDPGTRTVSSLLSNDWFLARSRYERTLTEMDAAVPPDQALVLFYEDLFSPNDDAALRRLTDFLGIDYVEADRTQRVNETEASLLSEHDTAQALRAVADTYRFVEQRFKRLPDRWASHAAVLHDQVS